MDEQDEVKIQRAWVERWCAGMCDYVYHSIYQGPPSLDAIEVLVVKTFTTTFQQPDLVDRAGSPAITLFSLVQRNLADFWRTPSDDIATVSMMDAPSTFASTEPWVYLPLPLWQMVFLRYRVGLEIDELAGVFQRTRKATESYLLRISQQLGFSEQEIRTLVDRQSSDLALPTGFEAKVRHKILSQLHVGLGSKGETAMSEQEKAAIELLKQGHEEAWHQFVEALGPTLHRRLLELTGDADKANDYMGEIFLLIVRSIGKIR